MGSSTAAASMPSMKLTAVLMSAILMAVLQMHEISGRGTAHCGVGTGTPGHPATCSTGVCCSANGFCDTDVSACGAGCQSGPCYGDDGDMNELRFPDSHNRSEAAADQKSVVTAAHLVTAKFFDKVFPHRNGVYTYEAFQAAAEAFPTFGTTGNSTVQRRDVAAFLAHVHHETSGLTKVTEESGSDELSNFCCMGDCLESHPHAISFSCSPGKKYFPRGPLRLTWNYNYGSASEDLGVDILAEPELVSKDAELSFKSALWVWTSAANEKKPSGHEVMTGSWSPSASDVDANRLPGFGTTIDVLVGHAECGHESDAATARAQKYLRVAKMLDVSAGPNVECATMLPF